MMNVFRKFLKNSEEKTASFQKTSAKGSIGVDSEILRKSEI
jgi:hypothetical protein